jgi:hypothetical protein
MDSPLEVERAIITGALLAAAAITYTCPCGDKASGKGLLSCHIVEVSGAIALASAVILYANR